MRAQTFGRAMRSLAGLDVMLTRAAALRVGWLPSESERRPLRHAKVGSGRLVVDHQGSVRLGIHSAGHLKLKNVNSGSLCQPQLNELERHGIVGARLYTRMRHLKIGNLKTASSWSPGRCRSQLNELGTRGDHLHAVRNAQPNLPGGIGNSPMARHSLCKRHLASQAGSRLCLAAGNHGRCGRGLSCAVISVVRGCRCSIGPRMHHNSNTPCRVEGLGVEGCRCVPRGCG